jgi:signal transduction histidine kinase
VEVDAGLGSPRRRLRYRIAAAFALGGLVITTVLAITTYGLIDRYLVRQRERTAELQTFLNARAFRDALTGSSEDVPTAIQSLVLPPGTAVVVHRDGTWYGTSIAIGRDVIPSELRQAVLEGAPAHERTTVAGTTAYVLGTPVGAADAEYFEVTLFQELDESLAIVRNSLIAAAGVATVGAALLGVWAGRRVLRPLSAVSSAAQDIAGGRLERRVDAGGDPDLAPLASSFNAMVAALQARIERDRQFAGDVSHELRSPLTTLAAAAAVLERRREELPERIVEPLDLLIAEIGRFERLVIELLELTRAQEGVMTDVTTPVQLEDLVRSAARDVGCADPPLVVVSPTSLLVRTDVRRVRRIVANLIDNAMTHGNGVTRIELTRSGSMFEIAVEDNGPGVPEGERDVIFERFARGRAAGRRDDGSGTGLGLALVAAHTTALGGTCRVETPDERNDRGARFVVEIPDVDR